MSTSTTSPEKPLSFVDDKEQLGLAVFRGIGQVFFQENALTGLLFAIGIAISSPLMGIGSILGAAIGTAVAVLMRFNKNETLGGIYGFNSALVGISTFFFFQLSIVSIILMIIGCALAAFVTYFMRTKLPFPTYTTPFIVVTWCVFFVGNAMQADKTNPADYPLIPNGVSLGFHAESTLHGVGQVMFQGSIWTGLFFLAGIAISDKRHACWVLGGAFVGMLIASYHLTAGAKSLDPERLIERNMFDNVSLGLYGYNATLAPLALFLWRRKLIPALLGMILTVPLTEMVPYLGLPALTLPFVLATWIVLICSWLEEKYLSKS